MAVAREAVLDWADDALDLVKIVIQRQENELFEPVPPYGSGIR